MGRVRLVLHKYASVVAQVGAAVVWVMVVGLIAGGLAFGYGRLPTLSGTTLGPGTAAIRIAASGAYAVCGMAGLAAIGLFLSALTDSGLGAAVATMALAITSQIVDGLSSLHADGGACTAQSHCSIHDVEPVLPFVQAHLEVG